MTKTKIKSENKIDYDKMSDNIKYFDNEERDLVESFKNVKVPNKIDKKSQVHYSKIFKNARRKSEQINIRLTTQDLFSFKSKAVAAGIPYQTLLTSLIHKYNMGRLVEVA